MDPDRPPVRGRPVIGAMVWGVARIWGPTPPAHGVGPPVAGTPSRGTAGPIPEIRIPQHIPAVGPPVCVSPPPLVATPSAMLALAAPAIVRPVRKGSRVLDSAKTGRHTEPDRCVCSRQSVVVAVAEAHADPLRLCLTGEHHGQKQERDACEGVACDGPGSTRRDRGGPPWSEVAHSHRTTPVGGDTITIWLGCMEHASRTLPSERLHETSKRARPAWRSAGDRSFTGR